MRMRLKNGQTFFLIFVPLYLTTFYYALAYKNAGGQMRVQEDNHPDQG